ncbi:MAG: OmpA family protein [Saprospiraceae bacterium]
MIIGRIIIISMWIIYLPMVHLSCQSKKKIQRTAKESSIMNEAKKAAQHGDIKKSNRLFEKVLTEDPVNVEAMLRIGSNYYSQKKWEDAASWFEKAITADPDFDSEMYYSLAMIRVEQKELNAAAKELDKYIQRAKSTPEKIKKAIKLRDDFHFIDDAIKNPVPFDPVNLGPQVNTTHSEYSPSLAIDGSYMIFTRNTGQEDFYQSMIDSNGYNRAVDISGLNTYQNEGAHTISADGKLVVFTACDRSDAYGSCDLYYAVWKGGKWTKPVNMGHVVNSAAWDSQPTLSADGSTLIFSSRRLGTLGGADLWMTYRNDRNAWVTPINLGPIINSTGDDESPFFHPDGQTLYFRSNGRPGMGDYDIYYSKKNDTTDQWQAPVNIGYPINTEGSEGSLIVSLDGTKAYFASDMDYTTKKKMNHLDIYSFELYEKARPKPTTFIKGYITDADSGNPLEAKVTIKNLSDDKLVLQLSADKNGYFINGITSGKNYACIIEHSGYGYHAENIDLSTQRVLYEPYLLNIALQPLVALQTEKIQKPIVLQNIFFKSGSAELLPESNTEINLLYQMLMSNPSAKINIVGYTDDVGKEEDNLALSKQRAKAVKDALIIKGIDPSRIVDEGKGETIPIADNSTEEGRLKNRRTEFVIIRP